MRVDLLRLAVAHCGAGGRRGNSNAPVFRREAVPLNERGDLAVDHHAERVHQPTFPKKSAWAMGAAATS